ncbi:pyruvate carboxyltransferase [Gordonia bronchialis DSM 43247]|uniref:Pyruvate carboxyltransferase n=1 Tax=Gordonia bronchialis (strain ATCC 25592 / DSM 43247 / BCRC 13721 / JCM 3198 / KCTC 3076 / NBRC 16047 / NCTC 10667) TaxID=526226 RepID=D0L9R1_GORB4|nr:hydroxymethylglutaryl-CoA lyase [Gordonia bronchialis]ACY22076.1 pyruvate carboxyltransferase [Gordonia bronchialis DSM 43247]MCC3324869.1 hydroxymethylglutaryl-CoA lyase [Gordonia bronchialis]QGS24358.1 hydroxymethylglutaryl-CoA lyase [Gordonia bronchialis]UAK39343.1 hydroxymethylglutaryl-CoA lyase [Gordonia bronchialis]STQ64992.1 Hydroxymethylglutaryl-CoA lyase yngG [Gordonia bronchialis]
MTSVELVEVGPRDGLQNEQTLLSVDEKVELITRAVDAGVRRIEAVSFVNPKRVPQMAGAEEVMAAVPRRSDVSYIGLVLNRRGLDRAVTAGVDEVNAVVVSTEEFSRRNQGCSVAEGISAAIDVVRDARAAGMRTTVTVATAFGCPFSGEVEVDWIRQIVADLVDGAAPDEIALADTIGVGVPAQVRALSAAATASAPGIAQRWHFHNTRNTGYANALTALDTGAHALDASIGGFGGCPFAPAATGNIASEDLLYALDRSEVSTGVDMAGLIDAAQWLGGALDKAVPALLGRAGGFPTRP